MSVFPSILVYPRGSLLANMQNYWQDNNLLSSIRGLIQCADGWACIMVEIYPIIIFIPSISILSLMDQSLRVPTLDR